MRRESIAAYLGLVLLAALAHTGSLKATFVFDDHSYVLQAMTAPPQGGMPWHCLAQTTRPLTYLSFLADYAIAGHSVQFYHIMNLVYHVLQACLLLALLRRLSERTGLVWACVALWSIHPVLSNVLGQVWQRGEMLAAIWYTSSVLFFVLAMKTRRRAWLACSLLCAFAGALTKETMVTLPAAVLLLHWSCFKGPTDWKIRQCRVYYLCLCAVWGVLLLMQLQVPEYHHNPMVGLRSVVLTPLEHALMVPGVQRHYLAILCVPGRMVFDPAWPIARGLGDVDPVGVLLLVGLVGLALYGLWRRACWGVLPGLYLIYLSPTTSIVPTGSPVQEYRMYLPSFFVIGSAVLLWHGVQKHLSPSLGRWLGRALFVGLGLFLVVQTNSRYEVFQKESNLWWDTVIKSPNNRRAITNLATAIRKDYCRETTLSRLDSLRDHPMHGAGAHLVLGRFLLNSGRLQEAGHALNKAQQSASLTSVHVDLGCLALRQGEPQVATTHFRAFLQKRRRDPSAEVGLVAANIMEHNLEEAERQLLAMRTAYPSWILVPGLQAVTAMLKGLPREGQRFSREQLAMPDYEGFRYSFGYGEYCYYMRVVPNLRFAPPCTSMSDATDLQRCLHDTASLLLGIGYPTLARVALQQVSDSGVQSADLYNKLSYAEFLLGSDGKAEQYLEQALALSPDALSLHWNRVVLDLAAGRVERPRAQLLALHRRQRPSVPFVAMALAKLAEQTGDCHGAARVYAEVLRVWPTHVDARMGLHRTGIRE